jgi:hypothetical protein
MDKKKYQYPESFNKRVTETINQFAYRIHVTNYGEKKSEFIFYTPSESYAKTKQTIILNKSPDANIVVTTGVIKFVHK